MFGNYLDRNRQRTVVFYGRVSTEHEAQLSALENQMQWYDDIAKRFPNWTVINKYIDEGITGTQAKKRPSFMRMIEDANQGKFDLIVTREVCRFARNTVDTLTHTRSLRNKNIEVYFVDDNIWTMDGDGELRLTIMATLAQEESRKVSERVKAGQHISREKNIIYGCGNILGYELKRNIDETGKWNSAENTYVIIPEDAETVRQIYDMYESGMGYMKIAQKLTEMHRKNASGIVKWSITNVKQILVNATYKGYHAYNQSRSNNYLEQKRIYNRDRDTFEYKKGKWEPIVSEEQWNKCQLIRTSKKSASVVENGVAKTQSNRISSDVWVKKLRCTCGSKYRKNRYHKSKDGKISYDYICYNQVNNGKASEREKHGLDTAGFCDSKLITEWKMDMMGEIFVNNLWKNRHEDLERVLEYIKQCYKKNINGGYESKNREIDIQIEKIQKRMKNLINMLADEQITKDEYIEMKSEYGKKIDDLNSQKTSNETTKEENSLLADIERIKDWFSIKLDKTMTVLEYAFIDKVVSVIEPKEDGRFIWHFRPGENKQDQLSMVVTGNKYHPHISVDECFTDTSDDEVSDIHIFNLAHFNVKNDEMESLLYKLHRLPSKIGINPRISITWDIPITLDMAREYQKAHGSYVRPKQWSDLTLVMCLDLG